MLRLHTDDGLVLEAEVARPPAGTVPLAAAVLCHPHPQHGGSMRAVVVSPLFEALPALGVTCLRFNFRGVEGSDGAFAGGLGERSDARAAVGALAQATPGVPLACIGFSFGADVALSLVDATIDAWVAIAPPLRYTADRGAAVGADARPKLVVLAQHDTFRSPAEVAAVAGSWTAARVETVAGASHFFVGRTERVVALVAGFVTALGTPPGATPTSRAPTGGAP